MNFLAHLYLSGDDEHIKFGNFIADWVKGKKYEIYPDKIKKGILHHREIDSFTDSHPVFRQTTKKLRPLYQKHAGIVTDILYDHFLASNWAVYSNISLEKYAADFYVILKRNYKYIPEKATKFLPFFIKRNRLVCYAKLSCFKDVMNKMSIYTSLPENTENLMKFIQDNYEIIFSEFTVFFNEIIQVKKNNH